MSLKQNIIYLYFKGKHLITSKSQYQYNHGQYLYFADLNLPQAFEVHFSNKERGESKTQIGSNKLVEIPDEYFWNGALQIYAWVYLHDGTDDGETIYEVRIPLIKRAKPTDEEPLPVQQSAIDKAIAELNNAVNITNENADKTNADKTQVATIKEEVVTLKEEIDSTASTVSQDAQSANIAAERSEQSAQNSAESERKALDYSDEAKGYAQSALESKDTANQKAQVANDASAEAKGFRDEAETFKDKAEQAKQNIVDYRDETKGYRDETLTAKDNAQTIKGDVQSLKTQIDDTADNVFENAREAYQSMISADNASLSASESAENASQSANEANQSATNASESASQAEEFKNQSATNVTHYPKVVDGYWYVWDASKNEYVNTNVDARGIKGDKGDVGDTGNGIESTVLNSDYTLTITFTDGTSYTTPSIRGEKGLKGDVGNGITSTVLNNDYTLTINFTNGTQYTTPPIRGKQGEKGNQGEIGDSGVYIGTDEPSNEDINVWIDSDGTADNGTVEDLIADITELKSGLNNIIDVELGTNLNNPETQTSGYCIAWSGNLTEAEVYDVSDFIPVEVGKSYSVGVYNPTNALYTTRTLYAFYDSNKALVGSVTNTDNASGLLATAPEGASYIRISGHTHFSSGSYSLMLAESDTILASFVPYSETMVLSDNVKVRGLDELEPLIGTAEYKTGKNLYDSSKSVDGFLRYDGNIVPMEGQNYKTSALIPVKPNTDYYVTGFSRLFLPYKTRLIAVCYTEGAFVTNTYINTSSTFSIVINSQNYSHIRVSSTQRMMVTEGSPATQYVDYVGGDYTTLKVETQNLPFDPILTGKKWAVCGDSFTNSGGTGTLIEDGLYKGRPYTYPWIIGNRQSMEIIKFFEGGRTLAYPSSGTFHNSLTDPTADCYYQNIPEDVDYITIYLGINDEHHATGGGDGEDSTGNIPLGTITDSDTSTYYGAWNVVLSWLITNRPNAHIGIIVTNGLSLEAYRTAQIEIARKYGIPFIDMNGDDRTPAMLRTVNPNIASEVKQALKAKWAVDPTGESGTVNTHPNDAAHEYESTFIENFLRSI